MREKPLAGNQPVNVIIYRIVMMDSRIGAITSRITRVQPISRARRKIVGGTDHRVLRFCFVKKRATLEEAVNRLIKL